MRLRCATCGHEADMHDDSGDCHVTILTGWKDAVGNFTGKRRCECNHYINRYKGDEEPSPGACPHERTPTSNLCVHCGKPARENVS